MLPKIISCAIVIIIHGVAALFGIAVMLLAMNGYNDRAAEAAIPAYIISQIIFIIFPVVCTFLLCGLFQDKLQWNSYLAASVATLISIVLAAVLTVISIAIGIGFGDAAFRR